MPDNSCANCFNGQITYLQTKLSSVAVFGMSVQPATQGRILVCRLDYESDLLESIKALAEKNGFVSATFSAIGAVKNATVSFYDQSEKCYLDLTFDKPLEVLTCSGNIGKLKGETLVHAHIALSDIEGRAFGGHLMKGTKVFAIEVVMTELKHVELLREFDPVTGLNLIRFPQ